jgi:hypothetical protein
MKSKYYGLRWDMYIENLEHNGCTMNNIDPLPNMIFLQHEENISNVVHYQTDYGVSQTCKFYVKFPVESDIMINLLFSIITLVACFTPLISLLTRDMKIGGKLIP